MAECLREIQDPSWYHPWSWRDCQMGPISSWSREEPESPAIGQGWFDEESNCLYIWDGIEWVCVPTD